MVYCKMKGIVLFAIVLFGLFCYIWVEEYESNDLLKCNLLNITKEIGRFSTDEIYLIDLITEVYIDARLSGKTISNDKDHIDIFFLATKKGKRIAEIKVSPLEEKMTVKYEFDNYNIVLYDPNTGRNLCLLECDNSEKWLGYEIQIDQVNEKVEIKMSE